MIFGAFGAALAGFILSAMPEWTGTRRVTGPVLLWLALPWALARGVGLSGAEALLPLAAACDLVLFGALALYALGLAWTRPAARLWGFAFWLAALAAAAAATRWGFAVADPALAARALWAGLLVFLVLLSLATARILPVVLNIALDPTRSTTPFRPHPGRRNLAAGLVALALAGDLAGLSPAVQGYLLLGAGAAFLDRIGDAFVGRAFFRAEVLALAGTAACAGLGLGLAGLERLGLLAGFGAAATHVLAMGALGLAVMAVFAISGLLHTGRPLAMSPAARLGLALVPVATALRVLPAVMPEVAPAAAAHAAASVVWAAAFLVWLAAYWPALSDPVARAHEDCG